ncbi:MAG: MFS transporter [Actinomycetota bacterium]|nr:MFS transporter [Actinomycetota bacterium]
MGLIVQQHEVDADGLAELRRPRSDVVAERPDGEDRWVAAEGPLERYERSLSVADTGDDTFEVTERIDFRLAVPVWRWLLHLPFRRALRVRRNATTQPWWAPPDRLAPRAATVLSLLAGLAIIDGYLGTLLSQTITFAADEFDASDSAQGATLAAVRIGVLVSIGATALADRHGRRRLLVITIVAACLATAATAAAPSLWWYGVSQTIARGLTTGVGIIIAIIAAEEAPARSRAYTASILSMTAALGSGMVVWLLPLASLGEWAWRILFLVPLVWAPLAWWLCRSLPESRRFEVTAAARKRRVPGVVRGGWRRIDPSMRSRLALLAASGFLLSLFTAPASQFQNEFLRSERGFSASQLAAFTLITNTPAGIGVVVGGRLADVYGRRRIGALGLVGGVGGTVAMYLTFGWSQWMWSVVGGIVGALTVPALGVYGPELFATGARGRANAAIVTVGVAGSSVGLLTAGVLSDNLGNFGAAMSVLAIGPLIVALLVLFVYPETAGLELEEINPGDRDPDGGTDTDDTATTTDPPPAAGAVDSDSDPGPERHERSEGPGHAPTAES